MKIYLEFHDATSHKFWQIEVQDTQHIVTFGKVDTSGQSKTKNFDNAEECFKDAEKLIKSKKAKGYAELGETAVMPEKKAKTNTSSPANAEKNNKQQALDALDQLIRTGKVEDVIPFVQQYAEGNSTALKKALSQAKRFWCDYQDLSKTPEYIDRNNKYSEWGVRGKDRHKDIIHLLAFALMNESDGKSTWNLLSYINRYGKNTVFTDVIKTFRPEWLGSFLKEAAIVNDWAVDYDLVRKLEDDQLIEFDPHLFGVLVSKFIYYDDQGKRITLKDIFARYLTDEKLIQRDIPLLFDYETRLQDYWFGRSDNQIQPWHHIFVTLINEQKISRDLALAKIIEIQTKDWNAQTKSFFKKIFAELNPTTDELLNLQDHLFVLLHSEFSATVGFALEYIKIIYQHADFKTEEYLGWLEPLMMRADLKSQIKNIIIQLQNLLKNKTPYDSQILSLLADVFLQSDLSLQERSAKLLQKSHAQANDDVKAKLAMYQDNLLGDVKSLVKDYFDEDLDQAHTEDDFSFDSALSRYHYQKPEPDYLQDAQKVELISSWQDLLFFMGQLPHTKNPLDFDILMSSWLVYRDQRPSDYKQQLEAVFKTFNKVQSIATYKTMFQHYFAEYVSEQHDHWTDNFHRQQANEHKILRCWIELMRYFSDLDLAGSTLPLLSLPTHAPSYIDPEILVQRILDYEQQDIHTNFTDLALALARMPRQGTEKAIQLAEKIQGQYLKDVVLFALAKTELPQVIPPQYPDLNKKEDIINWRGLWATVIHSHYPAMEFTQVDEFDHVHQIEESVLPYTYSPRKEYQWDDERRQYINVIVGQHVKFPLAFYQNSALSDVYHHQVYNLSTDNYQGWDYSTELGNGVFFRHCTPLNTSRTDLHVASNHCDEADRFSESSADVLNLMMNEAYILNPYALFILATHLSSANKDAKLYAIESFNHGIYQSKVDLRIFSNHLAELINHQYAPFSRLVESLNHIKDASPLHANALLQIIEQLIPQLEFKDKLPTQFKKFIELYYLIQSNEKAPISEQIKIQLLVWQHQSASLKPLINKLLKGAI